MHSLGPMPCRPQSEGLLGLGIGTNIEMFETLSMLLSLALEGEQ
jgi:hypothetical protein